MVTLVKTMYPDNLYADINTIEIHPNLTIKPLIGNPVFHMRITNVFKYQTNIYGIKNISDEL